MDSILLDHFAAIVGQKNTYVSNEDKRSYLTEWRDRYVGCSPMVLRPNSAEQVAQILKLANETQTPIVPQGGNTGLVGGQIPDETDAQIIVSLDRMTRIRRLDANANTITVDAGVILQTVQHVAEDADRLFPLSLGSQGSCNIGGNISTNAGGTNVLAYGNMRDLILGLEVVLPNGDIWNGLRRLRKDNTGYDLKNLFIGAEGTLGIITGAVLKLFAKPAEQSTAFAAMHSPYEALALLNFALSKGGRDITGFEIIPQLGMEFLLSHLDGARNPLKKMYPWYVLLELSSGRDDGYAQRMLEDILAEALEKKILDDAAIAQSATQSKTFWHMRHSLSEVQKKEGGSIKNDISVPIDSLPNFLDEAIERMEVLIPGCRPFPFGHLGDGNIHFNITQPVDMERETFLTFWEEATNAVNEIVMAYDGSIAAEHGIGRMKRHLLAAVKSPVELAMMRAIKQTFDPKGIMNPGKVL